MSTTKYAKYGLTGRFVSLMFGGMRLSDWLQSVGMTHQEFADKIGVSQSSVTRYALLTTVPARDTMSRIGEVTDHKVGPADFYE